MPTTVCNPSSPTPARSKGKGLWALPLLLLT